MNSRDLSLVDRFNGCFDRGGDTRRRGRVCKKTQWKRRHPIVRRPVEHPNPPETVSASVGPPQQFGRAVPRCPTKLSVLTEFIRRHVWLPVSYNGLPVRLRVAARRYATSRVCLVLVDLDRKSTRLNS